jgi:hypothetical protein
MGSGPRGRPPPVARPPPAPAHTTQHTSQHDSTGDRALQRAQVLGGDRRLLLPAQHDTNLSTVVVVFSFLKIATHKTNVNFFNFSNKEYNDDFCCDMRPI